MTGAELPEHPFDVAVIGLGPVGCAAAIMFADAGLRVVAFERDAQVYLLPRAVMLDGEIVRAFQRVGRHEQIAPLLQPIRDDDRAGFANASREWLFGREMKKVGRNGWPPGSMFDQPEVDGYLRRTALAHHSVVAYVGYDVTALHQSIDSDTVTISAGAIADGNQAYAPTISAQARYVVACDGASSRTRRSLDIGWQDLGYDHDWLVVDVVALEGNTLGHDTVQVCDPERLSTYVCCKDPYRRWEFKLKPGETREQMLDPERIASLIDPWTPRGTYEVRRSAVYRFHAATAREWRVGRIFLAGDAAHQTPPFIGQGLNAGMRDVVNLAWKLPLVLDGIASDALLNTYQAERDPHALDLVEWAVAVGLLMEHLAATEAAQRAGQPGPPTPPKLKSSGYGQGREQPPLRAGVVRVDQVNDTGSTGYLFNQPTVRDRSGRPFKLDERLGSGFAIVGRRPSDVELSNAARAVVARLGIEVTTIDDLTVVDGSFDRLFDNASAAVVRPDRYVFGHTTPELSVEDLLLDLAGRLSVSVGG